MVGIRFLVFLNGSVQFNMFKKFGKPFDGSGIDARRVYQFLQVPQPLVRVYLVMRTVVFCQPRIKNKRSGADGKPFAGSYQAVFGF
jgi:hypothetical protein